MSLDRCRAVVTGAGSGLGRAFCLALASRGARIVLGDVDLAGAEETARRVRERGGEAVVARCDVREYAEVEALADLAQRTFGGTDLLINNAGVAVGGPVGEIKPEDWKWCIDIDLLGVAYGLEAFVPRFRKQGSGYVINVASAAGLISSANLAPYNAAKAAVVAISETLAAELRGTGVNVTVLCPTFFQTNIFKSARNTSESGMNKLVEKLMAASPLQADDVARVALEHVERGELFCVPMADGRLLWRIKRLRPALMPWVLSPGGGMSLLQKLTGGK